MSLVFFSHFCSVLLGAAVAQEVEHVIHWSQGFLCCKHFRSTTLCVTFCINTVEFIFIVIGTGEEGKAKLSIHQSIFVPILSSGWWPKEWHHTYKQPKWSQAFGFCLRNRVRSPEQIAAPSCSKEPVPPELIRMPTGLLAPPSGGFPGTSTWGVTQNTLVLWIPSGLGMTWDPQEELKDMNWEKDVWFLCSACCYQNHNQKKQQKMDRWRENSIIFSHRNNLLILSKIQLNLKT